LNLPARARSSALKVHRPSVRMSTSIVAAPSLRPCFRRPGRFVPWPDSRRRQPDDERRHVGRIEHIEDSGRRRLQAGLDACARRRRNGVGAHAVWRPRPPPRATTRRPPAWRPHSWPARRCRRGRQEVVCTIEAPDRMALLARWRRRPWHGASSPRGPSDAREITASHSSSVMLARLRSRRMPALFTSTCRSPKRPTASSISSAACCQSPTSWPLTSACRRRR
jgi:hypothetical protein